jgi:PDZ domain-containing protein
VRLIRRVLVTSALLAAAAGAWAAGVIPCAVVVAQPACQLAVTGGPVLDTATLVTLRPAAAQSSDGPALVPGGAVRVREPSGRLLVTTIEVWEPDGVRGWWAALSDPDVDLVARARLVPDGGSLEDVAQAGRARMEESRALAVTLALFELGLVTGTDVDPVAWPVEASYATDQVGGPSAGLMLALGVVARLAPVDPTARPGGAASARPPLVVAGTGALAVDGRVVGVGGISHKLRSVVADARGGPLPDAFLLPADDLAVARRVTLDRDLLLVPVTDLAGAIEALDVLVRGGTPEGAVRLAAVSGAAR